MAVASQPRSDDPWHSKEYLNSYEELILRMDPSNVKIKCKTLQLLGVYDLQYIDGKIEPIAKNEAILQKLQVTPARFGVFREILRRVDCKDIAAVLDLVGADPATDAACKEAKRILD